MAASLIALVPLVPGHRWIDPFRGLGAFYTQFPEGVTKDWAEVNTELACISDPPRDYTTLTNYDWVVTRPPTQMRGKDSVRDLLHYYMERARVGIAFLLPAAVRSSVVRTDIEDAGWGITKYVPLEVSSSAFFFVVLERGVPTDSMAFQRTTLGDVQPHFHLGHRVGATHRQGNDLYETPPELVEAILPHIPASVRTIWECCHGNGAISSILEERGYNVIKTDLFTLPEHTDFLTAQMPECDMILTNPPFNVKDAFLQRAIVLGKPFLFLLPLDAMTGVARVKLYESQPFVFFVCNRSSSFLHDRERIDVGKVVWIGGNMGASTTVLKWLDVVRVRPTTVAPAVAPTAAPTEALTEAPTEAPTQPQTTTNETTLV